MINNCLGSMSLFRHTFLIAIIKNKIMYYLIKAIENGNWEVVFQSSHENELISLVNFIGDTFSVGSPKETKVYTGRRRFKVVDEPQFKKLMHTHKNKHAA